ncbi:MAG: hypothetical protein J7L61_04290 [Thermoplasmata archaeon]|nr:hypothetical protein [Thermoplasmata archaeon]
MDISEVDKSLLAMLSGVGFVGIAMFFYFFMPPEEYSAAYVPSILAIVMASLIALFYLLDDMSFMFNMALSRDDPDGFKTKVRRSARLLSGMFLMGLAFVNLVVFTTEGGDVELRVLIVSLLTAFSVFLFIYSMFMAED